MRADTTASMDAFLEALGAKSGGDGVSVAELADKLGLRQSMIRERLSKLIRQGGARHAGFRDGTTMIGRACQIPVYQIVKQKKKFGT